MALSLLTLNFVSDKGHFKAFLSSLRANLQISTFDDLQSPAPLSAVSSPNTYGPTLPLIENRHALLPHTEKTRAFASADGPRASDGKTTKPGVGIDHAASHRPVTILFSKKEGDTRAALRLIADSVLQQRRTAVQAVLFHPYVLAVTSLVFLSSLKILYTGSPSDLILMMAVWIIYGMIALLVIGRLVKGYDDIFEKVGDWSWLSESSVSGVSHKRDEVLVAQSEGEIVGVLVLRMARTVTGAGTPGVPSSGIRSRRKSSARWTGIIRAWTVREPDRFEGIGLRLLEEAVANCRLRSLDGPIFAADHANSARVLPQVLNGVFEKQEVWAQTALERTITAYRGK